MDPALHEASNQSWRVCFEQLAPKLLLYARQWVASAADAEDVVQNAFVRFWRRQPSAAPEHYPLLFAAVRTSAIDLLRSQDRRTRRENNDRADVLREDTPCFDPEPGNHEHAEAIESALERLPQAQREVIVLKIWGDLTFAQIAQSLDESINTIASRYRYALEALRRHVKPHDHEYERV
jgi:RNA polymerase sigma-70 factor (ECF subfamily)